MAQTIEQMTIGELMAVIRQKKQLAKQAPKLRKERAELLARLKQIDDQLAAAGPGRGARKKTAMAKVKKAVTTGKRQKGVKAAVLAVIGSKPVGAEAVAAALEERKFVVNKKTLMVMLSKLASKGEIKRAERGLYCCAGKAALTATEPQEAAEQDKETDKTVTHRIQDFLEKAKAPASCNDIHKAIPDATPGYIYNLLNALTKAKKVTHENGAWSVAKATTAKPIAGKATRATKRGKSVKQQVLDYLGKTKDLHRASEIRKALPRVNPRYMYNLLGELKKSGVITHENGMWGMNLKD